jgi:biotin carboxyl carrier protein
MPELQLQQSRANLETAQVKVFAIEPGGNPHDIAAAQAGYAQQEVRLAALQAHLAQLKTGGRPETVAQAQAAVDADQSQLTAAEANYAALGGTSAADLQSLSMYRDSVTYASTDNAQLTGEPVQVGSMNSGRVGAIFVDVGSPVHKNDVLAQVELPAQVGIAQNGQPQRAFSALATVISM